jgi:hypothetical protein
MECMHYDAIGDLEAPGEMNPREHSWTASEVRNGRDKRDPLAFPCNPVRTGGVSAARHGSSFEKKTIRRGVETVRVLMVF